MTNVVTVDFAGNRIQEDFSWSYSRLRNFETCPRRYHQVDLLKNFQEEDSDERRDGFVIHAALAKRITQGAPLPDHMPYEKWVEYVFQGKGLPKAEKRLAITKDFKPCDYFDKVKPVWLRTVADVLRIDGVHAHIVDWKTGKVKPDPEQLMLIATCVMVHYPQVFDITAELIWLGHNTKTVMICTVDDVVNFWPSTMSNKVYRFQRAHEENDFRPRKSGLCLRHCPVNTCEHYGQG
jgi:hypothetical protein